MTTRSEAFAAQAASDLDAYDILASSTLPSSHRLHYLQMWLEKLCKAYLWLPEAAADDLRSKHNVVDKVCRGSSRSTGGGSDPPIGPTSLQSGNSVERSIFSIRRSMTTVVVPTTSSTHGLEHLETPRCRLGGSFRS